MVSWVTIPYWWHATLLEALWFAGGSVALWLTVLNLFDSRKDLGSLEIIRHDPAVHDRQYRMIEIAAKGRTSSQLSRLYISLLIVGTGLFGIVQANPLGGRVTVTGLVVTVALVSISAITAARSWLDYRQRNLLYEMAKGRSAVIAAQLRATAAEPD